jgi:integrase
MIPYRTNPSDPWRLRNPSTGETIHDHATGAPLAFATREAALAWRPVPVPTLAELDLGPPPASRAPAHTAAAPKIDETPVTAPGESPPTAAASCVGNSEDTLTAAASPPEIPQETAVVPVASRGEILGPISRLEEVAATTRAARAANTLRVYRTAWATFTSWCARENRDPYSGSVTVSEYLRDLASGRIEGRVAGSTQTVNVAVAGISAAYEDHGVSAPEHDPGFRLFLRGLRREIGSAPRRQAAPITEVEMRAILRVIPTDTLVGIRDRALLLVGWAGCMRRSEIVSLRVEDVREDHGGYVIRLRRSKTDQEGRGAWKVIPRARQRDFCPVHALQAWLSVSRITNGYLFRGIDANTGLPRLGRMQPDRVADIVKHRVEQAGLDPAKFSGHSLRAGFLTAAARMGASERAMMNQSGHSKSDTLRGYIRDGNIWNDNAATVVVEGLGKG